MDRKILKGNTIDVRDALKNSLEHMFDFTDNFRFSDYVFPLYAKYFRRNSKYFAVKKVEIYAFSNFEHLLLYRFDRSIGPEDLHQLVESIKKEISALVEPNDEHMSSMVTLIVEAPSMEAGVAEYVRRFKYRKSFKLGFQGWVDMKILAISRDDGRLLESKLARGDAERLHLVSTEQ